MRMQVLQQFHSALMKRAFHKIKRVVFGNDATLIHQNQYPLNVSKGNNVSIHPSAILLCPLNGKIYFEGNNYVGRNVEMGPLHLISLGASTSIQDRCILLGDIEIGRYCLFAPNVYMSSGRHYYNLKPEFYIKDQDEMVVADATLSKQHSKKITIEDDCWIGINVVVMSGVIIGKGSVIAANAVITKNVEPYSIMAGAPATLVKKRLLFEPKDSIDYLNDADLPYFYSGFYTDLKSLNQFRKLGGIKMMDSFSVCINSKNKTIILLSIKNDSASVLKINYHHQTKELKPNLVSTIDFDINSEMVHKFTVSENQKDMPNAKSVLIQSVKTI